MFAQGFEKTVKELITTDTSEETIPQTSITTDSILLMSVRVRNSSGSV